MDQLFQLEVTPPIEPSKPLRQRDLHTVYLYCYYLQDGFEDIQAKTYAYEVAAAVSRGEVVARGAENIPPLWKDDITDKNYNSIIDRVGTEFYTKILLPATQNALKAGFSFDSYKGTPGAGGNKERLQIILALLNGTFDEED